MVTLCVAQAIVGIPPRPLGHLFPVLPSQLAYSGRRCQLSDAIEWLMAHFVAQSPGYRDGLLLVDSNPMECARSRETLKCSGMAWLADYGYCA